MAFTLEQLIVIVPIFLVSLTFHEFAHSFAALLLGDRTSQAMGRFSLNPLKHIDPLGFILFILFGFGWAKPVMVNRENLRHPLRDDVIISLSGPLANFILAITSAILLRILLKGGLLAGGTLEIIPNIFIYTIIVNISLAIFNLLPIPPLDGSHIITDIIEIWSPSLAYKFYKFGSRLILILIILERVTDIDFLPIGGMINSVTNIIFRTFLNI
ncbi:MAG: site-2 protease family protein [Maledivibacter sp.]|jgi:Zn-dependent protease|nr:site-2 protease family protein [Maledivibacter sp.]